MTRDELLERLGALSPTERAAFYERVPLGVIAALFTPEKTLDTIAKLLPDAAPSSSVRRARRRGAQR